MVSSWYNFAMCCSGQNAIIPMREGVSLKNGAPYKRRIVSMGNHIRKNNSIIPDKIRYTGASNLDRH
jgi:hypothetical protein